MFEECEAIEDDKEREECQAKVTEAHYAALDRCNPQVSCWDEAETYYDEVLAYCAKNEDDVEREICEKNAKESYAVDIEQCRLEECY
jgi:endonuclease YncB( thermonuclease family)